MRLLGGGLRGKFHRPDFLLGPKKVYYDAPEYSS
jgi:hypothetical protein